MDSLPHSNTSCNDNFQNDVVLKRESNSIEKLVEDYEDKPSKGDHSDSDSLLYDIADDAFVSDVDVIDSNLEDTSGRHVGVESLDDTLGASRKFVDISSKLLFLFYKEKNIGENVCFITIGSLFGTALRHGLESLSTTSSIGYVLSNFLGTAVLAYIHAHIDKISYTPIYVGIGTGFCGSLTTFSSWALQAGLAADVSRNVSISVLERIDLWFNVQVIGISVALAGWDFGKHLAELKCSGKFFEKAGKCKMKRAFQASSKTIKSPSKLCNQPNCVSSAFSWITFVIIITSLGLWAGYTESDIVYGLVTSPPGALLRWRLGKLNQLFKNFPIGTFIANVSACLSVALTYVFGLDMTPNTNKCNALKGFVTGFCGSLSSVSTWILELKAGNKRLHAYIYSCASILVSAVIYLTIIGGFTASGYGQSSGQFCF